MKVILIEDEGKVVGWKIEAETTEDKLVLGSMRHLQFFGINEDVIEYAGRTSDDDNYVTSMSYATKEYNNKQQSSMYERISKEE